jgi:inosine-uridine nucleoside N-ribohydrolase
MKKPFLFDMETSDPDDVFTLCLLSSHPEVELVGVTITPGSDEQVGIVHHILDDVGHRAIPVGSYEPSTPKQCVSGFHYDFLGKFPLRKPDAQGYEVIKDCLQKHPECTVLTGAPLRNFRQISEDTIIKRWVAQGGFAGDNIVPPQHRLPKFEGKIYCPTFNFNGDYPTALKMLGMPFIEERLLVSKNVCHGVVYDMEFHQKVREVQSNYLGLSLIFKGMDIYLNNKPSGKIFHDPLAACVAIEPSICEFKEVIMKRHKGEWGAEPAKGTQTFITISADKDKFFTVFSGLKS